MAPPPLKTTMATPPLVVLLGTTGPEQRSLTGAAPAALRGPHGQSLADGWCVHTRARSLSRARARWLDSGPRVRNTQPAHAPAAPAVPGLCAGGASLARRAWTTLRWRTSSPTRRITRRSSSGRLGGGSRCRTSSTAGAAWGTLGEWARRGAVCDRGAASTAVLAGADVLETAGPVVILPLPSSFRPASPPPPSLLSSPLTPPRDAA